MSGRTLERVPTGAPGLDRVLLGGFAKGGIHVIQGRPGTGKTTLANQICYRHAAAGGHALYVTLLAETHTRMLLHLGTMGFFDSSVLAKSISYVSGFGVLEGEGLPGLVTLLRREIAARRATVAVLDGLVAAEYRANSDTDFKKFLQQLQTQASLHDCTVFLLTTAKRRAVSPEDTVVDSIIELANLRYESRTERSLYVNKLRGSDFLAGRHAFRITPDGIVVFPRIEAALREPTRPDTALPGKLSTGVEELDAMIAGGLPEATIAALVGPSGIGKTTLGLQFLDRSGPAEPGLLFGFYESPPRLQRKAQRLGFDLTGKLERGEVEILWQGQGENSQDALAYRMLDAVSRRGVKRLFIDGLGGFIASSVEPGRISRFFAVLANELRVRGVTTLYTLETQELVGAPATMPIPGISSLLENLIAMRYVEHDGRMRRLLSVIKIRDSDFDPSLREFVITDRGIAIGGIFRRAGEAPHSGPEGR